MTLFPLDILLRRLVRHGRLEVIDPAGGRAEFGQPDATPHVIVRIHDTKTKWSLATRPAAALGEAYTGGGLTIEKGSLRDLLEIVLISTKPPGPIDVGSDLVRRYKELVYLGAVTNPIGRARRNVQHHYDLQGSFYRLFLDEDMQYSCAYFRDDTETLEEAQRDKKHHLARKLLLEPGMEVLDIGSGWGGLAIFLASEYGVRVTGVTLSEDQYAVAQRRAAEAGLTDQVTFKLQDYRNEERVYDRIVSVGMFEHVGKPHYREFFRHLYDLITDGGVAVLHTIGRVRPPDPINAWMRRYIFPGAYLPGLSQLTPIIEKQGLVVADLENLRIHYAKTLHHWDNRFQAHRTEIAKMVDDGVFGSRFFGDPTSGEAFCRGWEFYLQSCEAGFRYHGLCVFQLQLTKHLDGTPLTRDYMYLPATAGTQDREKPGKRQVELGKETAVESGLDT